VPPFARRPPWRDPSPGQQVPRLTPAAIPDALPRLHPVVVTPARPPHTPAHDDVPDRLPAITVPRHTLPPAAAGQHSPAPHQASLAASTTITETLSRAPACNAACNRFCAAASTSGCCRPSASA